MSSKPLLWLGLIAIVLLAFTAYLPALNGGFIWDDDYYVTQNLLLKSPQGLWQIWTTTKSPQYYPLVFTTFWIEQRLWGLNPAGYHTVNVTLHAINSILVWWLLRRLNLPGAWMIGAVFAVHPVQVESVAWISERKNVLSALFYLLSLGCYLQYESKRRFAWYAAALGLFIFALFSKTVVASLPVALLLIRYLKGWPIGRREILDLAPFFVIGAAMGLVTKWYEATLVGAAGPEWNLSMAERLLIASRALFFYIGKLLWPVDLTFNYPRWEPDVRDPIQWGWVLGAGAAGLLFWWKRHAWGRGPFVGLAFFSVSLSPALGFFNVYPMRYSFVADHFQYLASLGILALIIGTVGWSFDRRIGSGPGGRARVLAWMKTALGSLALVIFAALTWKQAQIYRGPETLWLDTLNKNPASWLARSNLGTFYGREGRIEEAAVQFLALLKLKPNHVDAHYNLGTVYLRQGRLEEAVEEFLIALNLEPDYTDAHNNLGTAYQKLGRVDEAIHEYKTALELKPDYVHAHYNLGSVYLSRGDLNDAAVEFLNVVRLQPDHMDARYQLGNVYKRKGLKNAARRQFEMILESKPNFTPAQKALESLD